MSRFGPWRWPAVLTVAATLAPGAVRGQAWWLDSGVQATLETNDNAALTVNPSGTVNTLSLSTQVNAARQQGAAATRIELALAALQQSGGAARDRVDGRLGITESLSLPRSSLDLGATVIQDFNSEVLTADVTVGRGRRRTLELSGAGRHAFSERLSASASVSASRASYGLELTQASDFRRVAASAGLSYLLSETDSVTVQASHSAYRTLSGSQRNGTDSLNVGFTRALSERASTSFSLGGYRSAESALGFRVACPLDPSFCRGGLLPFILVPEERRTARQGLDYSGSFSYRGDERTAMSASAGREKYNLSFSLQLDERSSVAVLAARQQAASGIGGEVRSETLSVGATRGLSSTASLALNLAQSRSDLAAEGGRRAGQRSLSVVLTNELTPDLRLQADYRHVQGDALAGAGRARSNSVSLALSYVLSRPGASR